MMSGIIPLLTSEISALLFPIVREEIESVRFPIGPMADLEFTLGKFGDLN
jgi:hypothetical protein